VCEQTLDSRAAQIEIPVGKSPLGWFRFLFPSVADLIFIILMTAMTGRALNSRLLGDASIGWHIRNGDLMLKSQAITRADPFSVTMGGQPWFAWEWLYDVVIAGIHQWLGLNGVVLFSAVVIAATFALTLRLTLRRGADLLVSALLLALSLGASMIHLFARPHVLSWLFTVIWFQLLDISENEPVDSRRLWWLPGLTLLWVNLHGGFVVGFVLLGLYIISAAIRWYRCEQRDMHANRARRLQQLGLVAAASLLASLVNPYGYRLHIHVYRYLSSRWLMNHIDEFLSPDFHGVAQQCFVMLLLITIVALAVSRKPRLSQILVILFATYSGLYASRSLPVSALLLTLVIGPLLTRAINQSGDNHALSLRLRRFLSRWGTFGSRMKIVDLKLRGHAWPLIAVLAGLMVCTIGGTGASRQWVNANFDAKRFPVQAVNQIGQRNIREAIFAPDLWGGYLIYRLYPQSKVFVDDRHDLYGEQFLKDYLKTIRLTPGWKGFLNDRNVRWVLLPAGSSLANMLELTSQWNVIYRDETAVLFSRDSTL